MMNQMVAAGNVEGLRAVVKDVEKSMPGYWQTTAEGRLYLRLATSRAIIHNKLGIVHCLCGERGVLAEANDERGAFTHPLHLPVFLRVSSSLCVNSFG